MPSMPRRSLVRRAGAVAAALCAASAAHALLAPGSAQAAPVSTAPPAISGALEVGQTLTASTGAWTDPTSTITSYAYQWQRCLQYVCTDVDYATSPSYTLTQSDSGEQVDVVVTAYDAAGALEDAVSEQTYIIGSASGGSLYAIGEAVSGPGSVTGETTPLSGPEADLACPGACGAASAYAPDTTVTLTAQPAAGAAFAGWGGACAGDAPTCAVTLGADEAVTATFVTAGAGGPAAGGEGMGPGAAAGAGAPALRMPARLLSLRIRGQRVQALVGCEQTASVCHLRLSLLGGAEGRATLAQRSLAVAPGRRARVTLALDRVGALLLARRRRLRLTARLATSTAGAGEMTLATGRLTLSA